MSSTRECRGSHHATLIFLNQDNRTWSLYCDATNGKPLNQLLTIIIDEKTLVDLEAKRVAEENSPAAIEREQLENAKK